MSVLKQQRLALGLLFVYFLLVNFLVLHAPITVFTPPDADPIQHSEYLPSDAEHPDVLTDSEWQDIDLPDDWFHSRHSSQQIWYRSHIKLTELGKEIWAVYLPSVTHNAAVYINGTWVGQGGSFQEPVSRHHNQPLLFSFSARLLQAGDNEILIRVKTAYNEQGLLDAFYLAPYKNLQNAYELKQLLRVDAIEWLTIIMYLMAVLLFVFWFVRPQDKIYGLFALELFLWATHNLNLFISEIPVSSKTWEAMTMSTLGWTVATMIVFNHRYVGVAQNRVDKAVMLYSAAGIGIFFLPDIGSILHIGYGIWDAFLILFGSYAIYFLLVSFRKESDWDIYLMLLAGVPILVFGFHDILTVNHFRDRRDGLIIQYSTIPAAALFSWFLIKRFVGSLNQAEQMAHDLEIRVAEKEQDLADQYQRLKELEHQRLLAEERERIMRDIHDGIGGQLVSVISMLQDTQQQLLVKIRERIQASLLDLRLVIDSLDPLLHDLPTLLGMMRSRINDQLHCTGIQLNWEVSDLPPIRDMSPQKCLHIMRIVQEAINNVVKHSNAGQVLLATGHEEESKTVFIEISDDGDGFDNKNHAISSRGLANMHYRAKQSNANLHIGSSSKGTTVKLVLATI